MKSVRIIIANSLWVNAQPIVSKIPFFGPIPGPLTRYDTSIALAAYIITAAGHGASLDACFDCLHVQYE